MNGPNVTIVVPHYNDPVGLDRCLSALVRQRTDRSFEIVVADNDSSIGVGALEHVIAGRARLTVNTERGAGPTRNAGVGAARGAILAFTDSDCIPQDGWLAAGIATLERCDIVGGRMLVLPPPGRRRTGAEAFEQVFAFDNEHYVRRLGFTVTANLFCRRAVFDAVGGFRSRVSEDLDWCHRARRLGYRINYAEAAVVGHPPRPDWPALVAKQRRIDAESYVLANGRAGGRLRWLVRTWALPASILAHAPRVLRNPALDAGEKAAALGTLAAIRLWRFVDQHLLLFGRR